MKKTNKDKKKEIKTSADKGKKKIKKLSSADSDKLRGGAREGGGYEWYDG